MGRLAGGGATGDWAERDALESAVIDQALANGLPLLGICRGAQLLNIRLGGNLFQALTAAARQKQAQA